MAERYIAPEERRSLETKGDTAYGTSYPMGDCDEVRRAIESYGRAPVSERPKVRREIIKRHRELGCSEPLPKGWTK